MRDSFVLIKRGDGRVIAAAVCVCGSWGLPCKRNSSPT